MIAAPRRFEFVSRRVEEPAAGSVLVELEGCGVCASNLPVWEGREWFRYPMAPGAPGHEGWGRVAAVGDGVETCTVGDRVAFLADDAYAESVMTPAADVVVLPPSLADVPFPGEALGCGFNVAARSGFAPGQTVAVVGAGFLGSVVIAAAAHAGARVLAVSRRSSSLEVARAMGATDAIRFTEPWEVTEQVERLTGGELCDVVVEAAGIQSALDVAGPLVQVRGRFVIAGFHQDGHRSIDLQSWNWRGIDVVNAHERDSAVRVDGIRSAVNAVAEGWLDPAPLYTHTFGLTEADQAMDALAARPEGFVKALVLR